MFIIFKLARWFMDTLYINKYVLKIQSDTIQHKNPLFSKEQSLFSYYYSVSLALRNINSVSSISMTLPYFKARPEKTGILNCIPRFT